MTDVDITHLTVSQAEKAEDSNLFVLNRTPEAGNVNFTVRTQSGNTVSVQAPITWIPYDLTMFAQKMDILRDPNFRKVQARGYLVIVDSAEAEKFMQENERARKELARLLGVNDAISAEVGASRQIPIDQQLNAKAPENANISGFIQNLVLRVGQEPADDIVNELDIKGHTATAEEIEYLMNNITEATVKAWCATRLQKLRAAAK